MHKDDNTRSDNDKEEEWATRGRWLKARACRETAAASWLTVQARSTCRVRRLSWRRGLLGSEFSACVLGLRFWFTAKAAAEAPVDVPHDVVPNHFAHVQIVVLRDSF